MNPRRARQGRERRNRGRGDSGAALSHGAAPASSVLRGGGGRNFLLALGPVNHHVLLEQRCGEVRDWESRGCCPVHLLCPVPLWRCHSSTLGILAPARNSVIQHSMCPDTFRFLTSSLEPRIAHPATHGHEFPLTNTRTTLIKPQVISLLYFCLE